MRQVELEKYKFDRLFAFGVLAAISLVPVTIFFGPGVAVPVALVAVAVLKWLGSKSAR